MDERMIVDLYEQPIEEGEFRTKNEDGQQFRKRLIDRGEQLSTTVDIVSITHGSFAPEEFSDGNDFATLIVYELRFVATGGRRFKKATVKFKFEDAQKKTASDPVVHAVSPEGKWALNKTDTSRTIKWGANAGASIGSGPFAAEIGLVWETERIKNRTYYTSLTGEKKLDRAGWVGGVNTAVWTLGENEDKSDGIPTFLRTAVLLRRPENRPFSFMVHVKTDVDFVGTMKTLFGMEKKDPIDPVVIHPGRGYRTITSLDPQAHDLTRMDELNIKTVAEVMFVTIQEEAEHGTRTGSA
ncbi:hypothetical protein NW752_006747 [Fusarium irregulare]|uniref:Uncharacterized protein n=1 Tax=Fusarium irregulare TaxID=2494466 RepID=A0A9W8PR02_9HYPO|nr:hypothetical protein NW766_005627 [Fusarium irregulare]KAJ4015822.1 hypothetical protein NW752_006747 [Fusarium irregulare]